jgi:hypothetical protein
MVSQGHEMLKIMLKYGCVFFERGAKIGENMKKRRYLSKREHSPIIEYTQSVSKCLVIHLFSSLYHQLTTYLDYFLFLMVHKNKLTLGGKSYWYVNSWPFAV